MFSSLPQKMTSPFVGSIQRSTSFSRIAEPPTIFAGTNHEPHKVGIRRGVPPAFDSLVKVFVVVADLHPSQWRRVIHGKTVTKRLALGVPPHSHCLVRPGSPR